MQMVRGYAFAIGSETNKIPVRKQWIVTQDLRTVLVERVRLLDLVPLLQTLPPFSGDSASLRPAPGSPLYQVASHRLLPPRKLAKDASINNIYN
ncbi:hypothetical protein SBV1_3380002 [Verrucomicrobia bacterium]|nr:hypothetical protein SBV1_3380002 [Verrucomicrobiota bacterium]